MAHVRETEHGYEIKVHIGGGKYQSQSIRAEHNKAGRHEADKVAADWQVQVDRRRENLTNTPTFAQVATKWQRISGPSWSENHARSTQHRLESTILPHWGERFIRDITLLELQEWFATLTRKDGQPMAPSSIATYKATMSGVFGFALDHDYVQRNLCESVKLPKIERDKSLPNPEGIRRTIRLTTEEPYHTMFHLIAVTGLRRGEACGLRWDDLDGNRLHVRRSITKLGSVKAPKSARGVRDMTLHPTTLDKLAELRELREYHGDTSYMFSLEFDGSVPMFPDTVTQWWNRNRRDDSITVHDLRHHAASQMLGAGIDVATVARRLGQDPSVTLSVYAHAIPQNDERAAEVLADLLREPLLVGLEESTGQTDEPTSVH